MKEVRTRDGLIQYLMDYSEDRSTEIDAKKTRAPLLKTYVIETFFDNGSSRINSLDIFSEQRGLCHVDEIDEETLIVRSNWGEVQGYLEKISGRFWLYYTAQKTDQSDQFVSQLVRGSVYLDQLWLSGIMFKNIWESWIVPSHQDHRYIRISFDFQDRFHSRQTVDEHIESPDDLDELLVELESGSANLGMPKSKLYEILPQLQKIFKPFNSINALRLPAISGAGGHDFYYDGKVTNRSNNFLDHRQQILDVCDKYGAITGSLEETVWFGAEKNHLSVGGEVYQLRGVPVTIVFNEPLLLMKFHHFIDYTFERGHGPFRFWGNPIWINEKLVHIYGLDLHLWQEIYLEMTPSRFIAVLPQGTCGNTIHRLVTNIQKMLEPDIEVYVGDVLYQDIIRHHLVGERSEPDD